MIHEQLLAKFPIISEQMERAELRVLLGELERQLQAGKAGNVVEFGCYAGTAGLFIARLLAAYKSMSGYHVYDSFEGLPEKVAQDRSPAGEQFVAGELLATKQQLIRNFKAARLPLPIIHKGWFSDLTPSDVPNDIMFAFLDGDYYESVKTPLKLISGKLQPNAIIIVDDYQSEALPGARKAVDEWLQNKPFTAIPMQSLAVIKT